MDRRHFLLGSLATALVSQATFASAARPAPARFSVEVRGTGPDVILIPGLASGRDVWRAAVAATPGRRFHLVQVSGFAGEPVRGNREGAVVAPLADEIARYIADRGLVRPAIVGHSMGGAVALLIAARRPALVGKVMAVDVMPQPASLFGGTALGTGSLLESLTASAGGRRLIGSLMNAFAPPESGYRRSDPDTVARAAQELAAMDLTPQLARIRAPLTIVYASPDPRAANAVDREFAAAYAPARGARFVRIDNSGHMVMLDQPARFARALQNFLRD